MKSILNRTSESGYFRDRNLHHEMDVASHCKSHKVFIRYLVDLQWKDKVNYYHKYDLVHEHELIGYSINNKRHPEKRSEKCK